MTKMLLYETYFVIMFSAFCCMPLYEADSDAILLRMLLYEADFAAFLLLILLLFIQSLRTFRLAEPSAMEMGNGR